MKKRYQVIRTVWHLGAYDLKKGDIVELEASDDEFVYVFNVYFGQPVWTTRIDFEEHCERIM
jgi:hypothetical protein